MKPIESKHLYVTHLFGLRGFRHAKKGYLDKMKGTGSWNGVESFGNQVLVVFQSRKSMDLVMFLDR